MTSNNVSPWLKQTQEFFCYISLALTEHMAENLHIFYSFKILHVTNFTTINEKITLFCKNIVLSHGKLSLYSSSKIQMNITACYPSCL